MLMNGDILHIVQFARLSSGQRVSSKLYLRADISEPVSDVAASTAIEDWLTDAYYEIRIFCPLTVDLEEAIVNIIYWRLDHWHTLAPVGTLYPTNPFISNSLESPAQVSCLVTFTTGQPRQRRTLYQWGVREDRVAGNYIVASYLERLVNFAVALLAPVSLSPIGQLTPVLVHALHGGCVPLTAVTVTDLVSAMHRRRPGA